MKKTVYAIAVTAASVVIPHTAASADNVVPTTCYTFEEGSFVCVNERFREEHSDGYSEGERFVYVRTAHGHVAAGQNRTDATQDTQRKWVSIAVRTADVDYPNTNFTPDPADWTTVRVEDEREQDLYIGVQGLPVAVGAQVLADETWCGAGVGIGIASIAGTGYGQRCPVHVVFPTLPYVALP